MDADNSLKIETSTWTPNLGDKITIQGYRVMKNGREVHNCKPGLETVLTVREIVAGSTKPAILGGL